MSQGARALGFAAATAALVLAVGVLGPKLLGAAAGPEAELVTRLKRLERPGVEWTVAGGRLRADSVSFQRISVALDADGQGATVTSTLDYVGRFVRPDGSSTGVSSLGLERARYRFLRDEWAPEAGDAPRLTAIVDALEGRRVTLNAQALPAEPGLEALAALRQRRYWSADWYVRSERDEVLVSEAYRLEGEAPERPVDEKGTRRLVLRPAPGGLFTFPHGLM